MATALISEIQMGYKPGLISSKIIRIIFGILETVFLKESSFIGLKKITFMFLCRNSAIFKQNLDLLKLTSYLLPNF